MIHDLRVRNAAYYNLGQDYRGPRERFGAELEPLTHCARERGHGALSELMKLVARSGGDKGGELREIIRRKWHHSPARAELLELVDHLKKRGRDREADACEDLLIHLDRTHGSPLKGFTGGAKAAAR